MLTGSAEASKSELSFVGAPGKALQPCGCRRSTRARPPCSGCSGKPSGVHSSAFACLTHPEPRSALSSPMSGGNASWRWREAEGPSDHRSFRPERKPAAQGLGVRSEHRGVPSPTELRGPARTSSPVSLERVSIHHAPGTVRKSCLQPGCKPGPSQWGAPGRLGKAVVRPPEPRVRSLTLWP